jgi:hypothetical protein
VRSVASSSTLRPLPRSTGRSGRRRTRHRADLPQHNTARVANNVVSREVVGSLKGGGQFEDVKDLVAGVRGRRVFDEGDLDAGIWTVGTVMGLIDDIRRAKS